MKTTKKMIWKGSLLCSMAAAMTIAVMPVNAEGDQSTGVTKDEDVFVVLNADGSVNGVTVSDQLHSDTGFSQYDDKSNLSDAQNLKSTDALVTTKDGYSWTSTDTDIYYQGTSTGELPLDITISYELDGKSISAEDLAGKSGHLIMTLSMENKKFNTYTVNGKTYRTALPIAAVAGAVLKNDVFSNVTCTNGTVTNDASHSIVAAVTLPGMKDTLEDILNDSALDSIEKYLNDDVVIEADVTDYASGEMMLAASTNLDELKSELSGTDLSSVWSELDDLESATNDLIDGTKQLYEGSQTLDDGSSTLQSGAASLASAAQALSAGASEVSDGASQVEQGAADLETGLGQLSSNSTTLNQGAAAIADSVFSTASNEINANSIVAASGQTYTLTEANYADVLAALLEINDTERASAKAQLKAAITAASGSTLTDENLNDLIYMASVHSTDAGFTTDITTQAARLLKAGTVSGYAEGYKTKAAAMSNTTLTKILGTLAADPSSAYDYMSGSLQASYPTLTDENIAMILTYTAVQYSSLDTVSLTKTFADISEASTVASEQSEAASAAGQQKIKSALDELVLSSSEYQKVNTELTALHTSLDGLTSFVEGLKTYTAGVDSAYEGSKTLADGASTLAQGASSLADGASQLSTGADSLKAGIDTLSNGIDTLSDGAKTLMDGMDQYNSEGISKLTDSTEVDDLKNAEELLKQMKQSGEDYNNYSGISDGTSGTVKFIYKVNGVKAEKTVTETTSAETSSDDSNFWQKLINLFVFWK